MDKYNAYEKIIHIFNSLGLPYTELRHEEVRTSKEAAELYGRKNFGIGEHQGAKALLLKIIPKALTSQAGKAILFVLPGDCKFETKILKKFFNAKDIRFLTEEEVIHVTNGVKPGGVPPLGNIFGIETYCSKQIFENEQIAFNAGDKSISIICTTTDWEAIVKPTTIY